MYSSISPFFWRRMAERTVSPSSVCARPVDTRPVGSQPKPAGIIRPQGRQGRRSEIVGSVKLAGEGKGNIGQTTHARFQRRAEPASVHGRGNGKQTEYLLIRVHFGGEGGQAA